jgi:hypothetical protein
MNVVSQSYYNTRRVVKFLKIFAMVMGLKHRFVE